MTLAPQASNPVELSKDICRRARQARDPRFDGEFFLAVSTTGIYCRPICPARLAAEKHVRYFRTAAQAAAAGYRPCLRCRPESAPLSPAWRGSATTVQRALGLIEAGALNSGTLPQLAERLGVGERYLRKLFQRELGISPLAVAQNQRLLFARKLLLESALPITAVAHAAGFGSVRRFNSAVRSTFRSTPSELRNRRQRRPSSQGPIELTLQYRAPYDWQTTLDFLQRHAVEGLESVAGNRYTRRGLLANTALEFSVEPSARPNALSLRLALADPGRLMEAVSRVRQFLDLDAHPAEVQATLGASSPLAPLVARYPGLRATRHFSPFEAALRAVAGQQVSTAAARTVLSRLLSASDTTDFDPAVIAGLPDTAFAMPASRRQALRAVCSLFADGAAVASRDLLAIKGVGPWTVSMYQLRGLGDPDVLPRGDLGLEQAWSRLCTTGSREDLLSASLAWRPWRAYAANLLWRSLNP